MARDEVRYKEQNIASLVEQVRRTAQERDLLRQQQHLLLAREIEASATPTVCPLLTSSPPVAVNRAATFAVQNSAAVDNRSTAAAAIEVPSFATRELPSGASSRASATPAACPLTSSSSPVAVDRAAMVKPFAVPGSAAAEVVNRSMAAALEVPSFAGLVGEDKSTAMALELLAARRPLPQQGRLVQAVMEAGPLLQNLLVAGPLPRWRNPPPSQVLDDAMISAPSGSGAPMGLPWSIH